VTRQLLNYTRSLEYSDKISLLVAKIFFFLFYIACYNLLNIDRVISKVEIRKGREAGTIRRWFTGALLLG